VALSGRKESQCASRAPRARIARLLPRRLQAIMLARGFTIKQMVELTRAGLATAKAERVVGGGKTIEVARVRITEAGRLALAERPPQMTKKLNAREPKYLVRARVSPPRLQIERFHPCSLPALQQ